MDLTTYNQYTPRTGFTSIITQANSNLIARPRTVWDSRNVFESYSFDLKNLINHCLNAFRMTHNLDNRDKLLVIKSNFMRDNRELMDSSDIYAVEALNKFSMFHRVRSNFRENLNVAVNDSNYGTCFHVLREPSREVTASLLDAVFYTKGFQGIQTLRDNLQTIIIGGCSYNPDVIKVYNFIIYSTPFIFCDLASNDFSQIVGVTKQMCLHSPFEVISHELISVINNHPFQNLSFVLKTQMQLENTLPDSGAVRNAYNYLMSSYYAGGRALGAGSALVGLSTFSVYIFNLLNRSQITQIAANVPSHLRPPVFLLNDDDVDRAVQIIINFVLEP